MEREKKHTLYTGLTKCIKLALLLFFIKKKKKKLGRNYRDENLTKFIDEQSKSNQDGDANLPKLINICAVRTC